MMFLHRVVLGSTVVVAFASSLLQTLVDDVNSEAIDTTTEPLAQCPLTVLHADFQQPSISIRPMMVAISLRRCILC